MFDPQKPIGEIGERALLRYVRSRIPQGQGVTVGVGDDAAAVETGALTLVTTDSLVEGVHFRREWSPGHLVGRKALSVNLSDIAAMAGIPRFATVSLCLPLALPFGFLDEMYDGLLERAAETGVSLVGGNFAATEGPLVVDVMLLGFGDKVLRRTGAQPGDLAVVTGTLGAAAEGLRLLTQGARLASDGTLVASGIWTESSAPSLIFCLRAHLDPSPPLAFARALAEHDIVHAAMDVSDGLSGDLLALCEEGDVSCWVERSQVPLDSHAAKLERARGGDALMLALHGGEDYQLLMAVPPDKLDALKDVAVVWDLPITVLGEFAPGPPAVSLKTGETLSPLPAMSHQHFATLPPAAPPPRPVGPVGAADATIVPTALPPSEPS